MSEESFERIAAGGGVVVRDGGRCDIDLSYLAASHETRDALCGVEGITSLSLRGWDVSDDFLIRLASHRTIEVLDVSETAVTGSFLEGGRYPAVDTLELADCRGLLFPKLLAGLDGRGNVQALNLRGTELGDEEMAILARCVPGVTKIDVSHTRVTDRGVALLAGCRQLRILHHEGITLSKETITALVRSTRYSVPLYL